MTQKELLCINRMNLYFRDIATELFFRTKRKTLSPDEARRLNESVSLRY